MLLSAALVPRLAPSRWPLRWTTIAVLLAVAYIHRGLASLSAYRALHRARPWYVAETIDKLLGIVLCCAAIYVLHRIGIRRIAAELGLAASPLPAFAVALLATSPMLVGFALTRTFAPSGSAAALLFRTALSPIAEEIEFRGYAFSQLWRSGLRWGWAAAISSCVFGWVHVEKGASVVEQAGIFLLTGLGGFVFCWLIYRWGNLWMPIGMHIAMNLWWELFSVARTAVGGWFPFACQLACLALAIGITLRWTKLDTKEHASAGDGK